MDTTSAEEILSDLCKTPARVAMLRAVLDRHTVSVTHLSKQKKVNKGTASRYLSLMVSAGVLVREGQRYRLVDSPLTVALRKLLNILTLRISLPLPEWADGIGAYGSWGMGTNMEGSDLDLWVYSKVVPPVEHIGRLRRAVRDTISIDVQILLLTPERIEDLRRNDPPFYSSLMQSMILIRGEQCVHA